MTKSFWRKQHKRFGLALCFFLLMFAISGIILNHRGFYSKVNVSRAVLPPYYKYENWNAGLLRGTLRLDSASTLIYGYSGLWKEADGKIEDFNAGMPAYADYRVIRNVIQLPDSSLMAVGQYGLYRRPLSKVESSFKNEWESIPIEQATCRERFTDIAAHGDSLVLLSRDNLYLALPPYRDFKCIALPAPDNYDGKVSLFRVFWLLHNGEIFGLPGRMALDFFGLAMLFLCLTGFFFWLYPIVLNSRILYNKRQLLQRFIKTNYKWHIRLGVWTFFILLFVTVTGWCLRPPLLIPLALNKMPGIPYAIISPDEPWKDKIRAIRYDEAQGDWLLSTSDGFFSLKKTLTECQPKAIPNAPHVSIMGINVFQKDSNGHWLIGSLSGMWRWNRTKGQTTDYFTAEPTTETLSSPFGKTPVSGFTADFGKPCIVEYYKGINEDNRFTKHPTEQPTIPQQPTELRNLPMSLWQLALEVHTGRLYNLFGLAPLVWIFLIGLATIWVLLSGWKLRH